MKILVTGSAGFMGSHLVDYLMQKGHEVYGMDNLSVGSRDNISEEAKKRFFTCDLNKKQKTKRIIDALKPEVVYHLAAWAHEGLSQFMPILITENNYNAYLNTLIPAIQSDVKRVVVCSSMSVYGDQKPPFDETMPQRPEDVYAVSKTAMEETTKILSEVHDFEYTILRPHNVYGPRQNLTDPYRNVVAIFMNRIMSGKPPIIYGDGEQTRAFSYIDDVTPYIAKAGFQNNCISETINVGPVEEYSINELSEAVLKAFNSDMSPVYHPERPKEVKHAYCTNDKVKHLLGYETSTSLEKGIEKMAKWAKSIGSQEFEYLGEIELTGDNIPEAWKKQLM